MNAGRFIAPIARGRKSPPVFADYDAKASNDEAQIRIWAKKYPGCGWLLAPKKSGVLVIDVDTKPGKNGQATFNDLDNEFGFPPTEMTCTPSGGFHLIYEGKQAFALGGLGDGIDIPQYTLIPGNVLADGGVYANEGNAPIAKAPDWIPDLLGRRAKEKKVDAGEAVVDLDKDENIAWAIDFLRNDAEPAIEGQNGDGQTLKIAMGVRDRGISQEQCYALMLENYNERCDPPWEPADLERKVANAYSYASQTQLGGRTAEADFADDDGKAVADAITPFDPKAAAEREQAKEQATARDAEPYKSRIWTKAELAERWVYIADQGLFICRDAPDRNDVESDPRRVLGAELFDKAMAHVSSRRASDILLKSKKGIRRFDKVVFKPGREEMLDIGYNLYRKSTVVPTKAATPNAIAALKFWNEHLAYLFPDEADRQHLLNWIAWLLQNLDKKPKHALLLQGHAEGTGKSFIAEVVERILDSYNVFPLTQSDLGSPFNSYAMSTKLMVIEELCALDRAEVKNRLHPMVTQERIGIHLKGKNQFKMQNCFGVFGMTNEDAALVLRPGERRFLVLRTDAVPHDLPEYGEGYDPIYYTKLYGLLDDPEAIAAIAYYLMVEHKVGNYNGAGRAPMTQAKADMVTAGANDIAQWMIANDGTPPLNRSVTTISDVFDMIPERLTRVRGVDKAIAKALAHHFKGAPLGKVSLGNGKRASLWAINGRVPRTVVSERTMRTPAEMLARNQRLAKLYLADKAHLRVVGGSDQGDLDDLLA